MSFADERRAIEQRLQSNWGATTPIKYDNVAFTQPANSPWIALTIVNGDPRPASISTQFKRYPGIIQIDIYTPENSGTNTARAHADTLAGYFDHAQFSAGSSGTITCRVSGIRTLPKEGGFYRLALRVEYYRDKT